MKIFLVRHGQSIGNADHSKYFEKHDSEIELTDLGKSQIVDSSKTIMKLIDEELFNRNRELYGDDCVNIPAIRPSMYFYSSGYKRAIESKDVLIENVKKLGGFIYGSEQLPLIREREWGELRDITYHKKHTDDHFNFYYRPVNGESYADAYQRAVIFHQHLLRRKVHSQVIVAHGEFNKVYMMYLLGWSVEEFNSWKSPKNGEVFLIDDGKLSSKTPLTPKHK